MEVMEDTSTPPVMEDESFLEHLNTVLGEKVPNLTVLQCWSRFNLCFIQIGESNPLRNMLEIRTESP